MKVSTWVRSKVSASRASADRACYALYHLPWRRRVCHTARLDTRGRFARPAPRGVRRTADRHPRRRRRSFHLALVEDGGRSVRHWLVVLLSLSALAGCHGNEIVEEQDGAGAITSSPGQSWGVNQSIARLGSTWSAGSVLLCRTSADQAPRIESIEPLAVTGQVELVGVGVRTTAFGNPDGASDPDTHLVGLAHGIPDGVESPQNFLVPTTCEDTSEPVGEVVVTLKKTGDEGGQINGLTVTYTVDGEEHAFVIQFQFGLCGTPTTCPDLETSS